jgi:hypothetical protein
MSSLTDRSRSQGRGFFVAAAKKTRGGPSETRHGGCLRIEGGGQRQAWPEIANFWPFNNKT